MKVDVNKIIFKFDLNIIPASCSPGSPLQFCDAFGNMDVVKHMKWSGWGEEGVSFQHKDKPAFAAFVKSAIDIDVSLDPEPVQDLAQMEIPPANVPSELISELQRIAGIPYISQESSDRVAHAW
jgi:alkyldihydroxyacetonephosphate synthase